MFLVESDMVVSDFVFSAHLTRIIRLGGMCKELINFLSDVENDDKADNENCYFLPHKKGCIN